MNLRYLFILIVVVIVEIDRAWQMENRLQEVKDKVLENVKNVVIETSGKENKETTAYNWDRMFDDAVAAEFQTTTAVSVTASPLLTAFATSTLITPFTATTTPIATAPVLNEIGNFKPMLNLIAFNTFDKSLTSITTTETKNTQETTTTTFLQNEVLEITSSASNNLNDSVSTMPVINADVTDQTNGSQETNSLISPWTGLLILMVSALWFASAAYLLLRFCRKRNNLPFCEDVELLPTMYNTTIENKAYFYLHEQIPNLEYNISYEVDRNCLEFGNFIANGHFGEIYEGQLSLSLQGNKRTSLLEVFPKKRLAVAIKVSGNAQTPDEIALRKKLLEDELKIMCTVGSHPNVVTLVGAITRNSSDGILILMEKCSHGNLCHFLKSRRNNFIPQYEKKKQVENKYTGFAPRRSQRPKIPLPVQYKQISKKANWKPDLSKDISTAHLLSFGMQIAQGMKYLSSVKCVHRDLAARNILVTPEGIVKIADFGLAKRIGYTEYYRSQANHELPCRWMSAESLRDRKFSVESDIWSYGILLYEIFTLGGIPYSNISNNDVLQEEITKGTQNEQPEYCPDPIYDHMTLCWAIEKSKRPSFQKSEEIMKNHLSMASEEVLKKVTEEFQREFDRQNQLSNLRSEAAKKRLPQ